MAKSDRSERYIEFLPNTHIPVTQSHNNPDLENSTDESISSILALDIAEGAQATLTRVVIHPTGLISTLTINYTDLAAAYQSIQTIPLTEQIRTLGTAKLAMSYLLKTRNTDTPVLTLRYAMALVHPLELRVDISTGGSMPANARVLPTGQSQTYLPDTLADGRLTPQRHRAARSTVTRLTAQITEKSRMKVPEDLLAVLGPQWRPLTYQGDHWKGLMRKLGKGQTRMANSQRFFEQAVVHLENTLAQTPEHFHHTHLNARWWVYVRRLKPVMLFLGILAMIPLSWFLVSGVGMQVHPMALSLTPLLMVAVVAITRHEIPIMEIPPRPALSNAGHWSAFEEVATSTDHTPREPIGA